MQLSFTQAAKYGFSFPGARMWIDHANTAKMAQDAALITSANSSIPAEFTAYIDPEVVDILTAPRNSRELLSEEQKGDWTTAYMKWRTNEITGTTSPYSDYGQSGKSGMNVNWLTREQYRFSTIIDYGDLEVETSSVAKINLAAEKQRAAATTIDIDANKFYLLGVEDLEIYGALNDPNLPAAISPTSVTVNGSVVTEWADKNTQQRYNDCLALFQRLVKQSNGIITNKDEIKLAVSPDTSVMFGGATDFNVSVLDMLHKYFSNLTIIVLPQLSGDAGETMFMFAPKVAGMQTGLLGFGAKFRAGRIIPALSSFSQKFTATTYGGIIKIPFAFAQMVGV
ncbi:major capsid family protein [Serratia sp. M24T3]|uniref:major capsid family protein n=1 Tax=Serratia sp. M24T3 TaxID=932213 RepID=UPI00025B8F41|nr:major capsid family protein [Serratia sp. M24T3]EIC83991.1 gp12 [Serratia sp. M24T3]